MRMQTVLTEGHILGQQRKAMWLLALYLLVNVIVTFIAKMYFFIHGNGLMLVMLSLRSCFNFILEFCYGSFRPYFYT